MSAQPPALREVSDTRLHRPWKKTTYLWSSSPFALHVALAKAPPYLASGGVPQASLHPKNAEGAGGARGLLGGEQSVL